MKKLILKIVIGIVAVPTVVLGGLYITRGIPVVSKYVIKPMAQLSQSIGIPVIIMPSDNYFKQEAKEVYDQGVEQYNRRVKEIGDCIVGEAMEKSHKTEGVSIYQNCIAGVKYSDLIIKPYEQFEKEWVEYSKEFYKNSKKPTKEDIENYNNNVNQVNAQMELEHKKIELTEQINEAYKNGEKEKAKQLEQQLNELQNQ